MYAFQLNKTTYIFASKKRARKEKENLIAHKSLRLRKTGKMKFTNPSHFEYYPASRGIYWFSYSDRKGKITYYLFSRKRDAEKKSENIRKTGRGIPSFIERASKVIVED